MDNQMKGYNGVKSGRVSSTVAGDPVQLGAPRSPHSDAFTLEAGRSLWLRDFYRSFIL